MTRNSRNKFMIDLVLHNDTQEVSIGIDESETYKENINNTNKLPNNDDGTRPGPLEPSNEDDFIENSDDSVKDPNFIIDPGMLRRRFFCNSQEEITDNLSFESINILQQEVQFNSEKIPNYDSIHLQAHCRAPVHSLVLAHLLVQAPVFCVQILQYYHQALRPMSHSCRSQFLKAKRNQNRIMK
ncbi:unnamed protein product [Pieris macdunnoughi]|uniref:Uncharacterized protein n=1 Tax=Pieris macdunnoughi TaxID=345717 RepID=A0A821QQL4_9NEOP|nr:unnamed protein product [Pieris macdunnoughi]